VKQKSHINIQMANIRLSLPNTLPITIKSSTLSTLRVGLESSSRANNESVTENSAMDKHSSSDHEGGDRHSAGVEPIAEHADEHANNAAGDHDHHAASSDASINPISPDIISESGELQ